MAAAAALLSLCFGAYTPSGDLICDDIVVTKGAQCDSGYSLISEDDATRCGATLCDLWRSYGQNWGFLQINSSTERHFFGGDLQVSCGLTRWPNRMDESLCAPTAGRTPGRSTCPSADGPQCVAELASGLYYLSSDIAVSHDDTLAAVTAWSGLHVYNVKTGAVLAVPSYDLYTLRDVAFSPDGDKVAVAVSYLGTGAPRSRNEVAGHLREGGVAVVSLSSGTELWSDSSKSHCTSVAYSPDGTRVASGHSDGSIHIWNAATGALVLSLTGGHVSWVHGLTYTLDGGRLFSGSKGNQVVVWNAMTGTILKTLPHHASILYTTKVSPDGLYFATVGEDEGDAVTIYKLSDYSLHKKIRSSVSSTFDVSFSRDWSKLLVLGTDGMEVHSVETGTLLSHIATPSHTLSASYLHTSDAIVTGESGRLLLWDEAAPTSPPTPAPATPRPCPSGAGSQCRAELRRVSHSPWRITVSHDDTLVALVSSSGVDVLNAATGAVVKEYYSSSAYDVAFSPDGDKLAVALLRGGVEVISLSSPGAGLLWRTSKGCTSVAYSPDGTRVASGHSDGGIHIWNAETGALVLSLTGGHRRWANALSYTLDGRLVSGGLRDTSVFMWDTTTGAILETWVNDIVSDYVTYVSPDGLYFAIVRTNSYIYEYAYVTVYNLGDYSFHKAIRVKKDFPHVAFSQDWSRLVAVGSGDMEVYSVETGNLLESHAMPTPMTRAVSYFHTSSAIVTGEYGNSSNAGILLWSRAQPPPTTAVPPARICTEDATCRVFGDVAAYCTSSLRCACRTHSGPLCQTPVVSTPTPVPDDAGDSDLSDYAITIMVVGSVIAVAACAILLAWCGSRAPDAQDDLPKQQPDSHDPSK